MRGGAVLSPTELMKQVRFENPVLDTYVQKVFAALNAEDAVFYSAALEASLTNRARARALTEGASDVAGRAAELLRIPDDALFLGATRDAAEATFKDETVIGDFLKHLQRGPGKYIVPFSRTPGAIATRQIEYSPVGALEGTFKAIQVLVQGPGVDPELQRTAAKLLGRAATGTTLMGLGYLAYKAGLLTPPTSAADRSERDTENLTGDQAGSIRLGGKNYGIVRLTPVANMLLLGAVLGESLTHADAAGGATGLAATMVGATVAGVMDQPFLQGVDRVLRGVRDPAGAGVEALTSVPSGFIPAASALGAVARVTDPTIRETRGGGNETWQQIQARIPVASRSLPPQRDQFGRVKRREGGVANLVSPVTVRTRDTDPLVEEIARLGVTLPQRRPTHELGPAATRALIATEGPLLVQRLQAVRAAPSYRAMSDEGKREAIENATQRVRSRSGKLARLKARLAEARP
jgi:hypothetical protein